ncbi:MAG: IS110 family transposase [Colwellia sp.]|nr:IS110 family transposase [Colwellia sp.]
MSKESAKKTFLESAIHYLKYSVGTDISKKKFDCCISVIDNNQCVKIVATKEFKNSPGGFNEFYKWQQRKCKLSIPVVFAMEATGVYYEQLAWFLHRKELYLSVILPNKSKKYIQCLGLKSKNDKIDAKGISRMAAEQRLEPWVAPREAIVELRSITRHRESLQVSRTRFNNQLSALKSGEFINESIESDLLEIISLLDRNIKQTEKMITEKIKSDKELSEGAENIIAIKGVSFVSVGTILAETNCFKEFANQNQLTSYSGYDVIENQSGKHIGKTKISKKGNSHIRRIMHMPALNVVSYGEPVFVNLYERVYARTKIKMKGYVAVQRELLCLIYTLWKKKEKYDSKYYLRA